MDLLKLEQHDIVNECLRLKSGGMSIPMGGGKTLMSLVIGLENIKNTDEKILIVVSKTLIPNWIIELNKFFPDIPYLIMHKDYIKKIEKFSINDAKIILITSEVASKYYKLLGIETLLIRREIINEGTFNQHEIIHYISSNTTPYYLGTGKDLFGNCIYSTVWNTLIIDEAHQYTKISTNKSRSIISICAKYRWCLSGTLFDEPIAERIL